MSPYRIGQLIINFLAKTFKLAITFNLCITHNNTETNLRGVEFNVKKLLFLYTHLTQKFSKF